MERRTWMIGGSAAAALAVAGLWWLSPGAKLATPADGPPAAAKRADFITLRPDQMRALGLELAVAEAAATVPVAVLPARIVPPPNARVAVAAQLAGVVTRVFVVDGEEVRAGQPLATVASRDMVGLNADLARARSRQVLARADAARLARLSREGIIAPARADQANALARQSDVDVGEQARLIALAGGAHGGGAGYTLVAPITGRISSMTAETGKALDVGAAPFVIDGGGALQVTAQLPERLFGTVRPGMRVRVGDHGVGTVLAVGGALDPETRSTTVTASLPAAPGVVAGGAMPVTIDGPAPAGAVSIPARSVVDIDGRATVFVIARGGVATRAVSTVHGAGDRAIVTSGLRAGERVVSAGLSELKMLAAAN
ncbi:efflux RND transporter periplasmic adaptor subunit [Sphingomonas sp. CL5.1]|uniref:efflux RND transporter periplasmic adaptor subunit n=1 Tax=Sphingomonas sp. CL5.1 TaxID=2653203 RepID=UPI0015822808|nr:efflux RND transporter periplasmic adaptor subunit [Sphingomonas sp. CL5.1]QKR99004.1 efflux RND transporter periplasmic adaptor subunit [Sphingomonas sp. CL5.1]